MSKKQLHELIEELDDFDTYDNPDSHKRVTRKRESKRHEMDVNLFIQF